MNIFEKIAGQLVAAGAPVLGGLIRTGIEVALPGPLGKAGGALAGRALEAVGEALGVPAMPDAVAAELDRDLAAAAAKLAPAERAAPELMAIWTEEARRVTAAQEAEIASGFTGWHVIRTAIQAVVWGGWAVILAAVLFGGNAGVKTLMPAGDIVTAWVTVTWVWMAVFHGGHTAKEIAGVIGRKK